jgi:divalent metal cation (Fe/Co/Zn/Cd) transporter
VSLQQRNMWTALVTTPVIAVVYAAVILGRARTTPIEEVAWVAPMLWAIGALIVSAIVGAIVTAVAVEVAAEVREAVRKETAAKAGFPTSETAGEATRRPRTVEADERDKGIERLGDARAGAVALVGLLVVLVATMLDFDRFWIAHLLFGVIIVAAVYGGIVKAVAYRRGF